MLKTLAASTALLMAIGLSACASEPHSEGDMLSGAHAMGSKSMMSDKAMPSHSRNCTPQALADMPPEHRQMCEGQAPETK